MRAHNFKAILSIKGDRSRIFFPYSQPNNIGFIAGGGGEDFRH